MLSARLTLVVGLALLQVASASPGALPVIIREEATAGAATTDPAVVAAASAAAHQELDQELDDGESLAASDDKEPDKDFDAIEEDDLAATEHQAEAQKTGVDSEKCQARAAALGRKFCAIPVARKVCPTAFKEKCAKRKRKEPTGRTKPTKPKKPTKPTAANKPAEKLTKKQCKTAIAKLMGKDKNPADVCKDLETSCPKMCAKLVAIGNGKIGKYIKKIKKPTEVQATLAP